ncbi:MAG: VCBS repeat-containing protein [Acidobacteria bacterium]|nr:VCBS repeat-containing protein [Acidobacteriota bacterium]
MGRILLIGILALIAMNGSMNAQTMLAVDPSLAETIVGTASLPGWIMATGDLNDDWILDLLLVEPSSIRVWLGDDQGTFRRASSASPEGSPSCTCDEVCRNTIDPKCCMRACTCACFGPPELECPYWGVISARCKPRRDAGVWTVLGIACVRSSEGAK